MKSERICTNFIGVVRRHRKPCGARPFFATTGKKAVSKIVAFVLLGFCQVLPGAEVHAEPQPSKIVANHESKQCGVIFGGDECMDCFPPSGWEVLDTCPASYELTQVEERCVPRKDSFCCTWGHSGANGECADMVVNDATKQCAFVESVQDCELPDGWRARPVDARVADWLCPTTHDWTTPPTCKGD